MRVPTDIDKGRQIFRSINYALNALCILLLLFMPGSGRIFPLDRRFTMFLTVFAFLASFSFAIVVFAFNRHAGVRIYAAMVLLLDGFIIYGMITQPLFW